MNKHIIFLLLISNFIFSNDIQLNNIESSDKTIENRFTKSFEDDLTSILNAIQNSPFFVNYPKFIQENFKKLSRKMLSPENIKSIFDIYKKHFTDEEIKQILDFDDKPAVKKMTEKYGYILVEYLQSLNNIDPKDYKAVYDNISKKYLNEEEVKLNLEFDETTTGKKFIESRVLDELMIFYQKIISEFQNEIINSAKV